jgi:glycosyltransferase involved in cell wall biosynthesis
MTLSLAQLPAPPPARVGWPWTEESPGLSEVSPDGTPWPRLTVVTPSLNQGLYLEETIRSVLLQGYPNLEYMVIDGGSTDDSANIIRKYEPWLAHWESVPDRGQSHAINKGFARASGQICAWLNSDDTYLPLALSKTIGLLASQPTIDLVYGSALEIDPESRPLVCHRGAQLAEGFKRMTYWRGWSVPQPTMFFRANLLSEYGNLDESFRYSLDYEWIVRVTHGCKFKFLEDVVATYRIHDRSKTAQARQSLEMLNQTFTAECARANRKHAPLWKISRYMLYCDWLALTARSSRRRALDSIRRYVSIRWPH